MHDCCAFVCSDCSAEVVAVSPERRGSLRDTEAAIRYLEQAIEDVREYAGEHE